MTDSQPQYSLASGIITILITVFAMALTDAFVKFASTNMTLWQIFACRSALALPLLVLLAGGRVRAWGWGWIALRSAMLVAMYLAIYAAIPVLDLSVIAASLYTGPLFIVLLSRLFLSEPIRPLQWAAVGLGFLGVLCVVQPTGVAFTPLALIPIIAALLYAGAAVLTRAKCAQNSPITLAIGLNAGLVLCGAVASISLVLAPPANAASYPFLLGRWSRFDDSTALVLAVMVVLIVVVTIGLSRAYQSPRPQVIATFDYAYLIFAAFWGYMFFSEVPDAATLGGIALIIAAGGLVLLSTARAQEKGAPLPERPIRSGSD